MPQLTELHQTTSVILDNQQQMSRTTLSKVFSDGNANSDKKAHV